MKKIILVEVDFVEASSGSTRAVGIKPPAALVSAGEGATASVSIIQPIAGLDSGQTQKSASVSVGASGATDFSAAGRFDNGAVRVLSQPRLVCASGEKAQFVAGGEIPIVMVTQSQSSVEFKKFGILLDITPTADRSGNIAAEIHAEVSDVDRSIGVRANGFDMPGLRVREVKTSVTVKDGQTIILSEKGAATQRLDFECEEITIGRVDENDICLPKGNISKKHTKIVVKDGKIIVLDLKSTNGTYVNGKKLAGPQVISPDDKVFIGDFILNLEPPDLGPGVEPVLQDGDEAAEQPTMTPSRPRYVGTEATRRDGDPPPPVAAPPPPKAPVIGLAGDYAATLQLAHDRLIEALDLRRLDLERLGSDELWKKTESTVRQIVIRMDQTGELDPHLDREELVQDVINEALGLGPLETYLADETVSEIMVNI